LAKSVSEVAAPSSAAPAHGDGDARWVTLGRARDLLGVDESTLRRWADTGRLRVYRTPGGHRRFLLDNLEDLVAGEAGASGRDEVGRLALARIRRQLQRARQDPGGWYAALSEPDRQKLREQGRRLIAMVGAYFDKRARPAGMLEEARAIGVSYGQILVRAGLPLPHAVEAYIGFRKTMDQTSRQASEREGLSTEEALVACGQVHSLGDQVLLGIASAYEGLTEPSYVLNLAHR
jgi:excisionase family DNA binding protein